MIKPFMYGVRTPCGEPHYDEFCVSSDCGLLEDSVHCLNEQLDEGAPEYEVIPLYSAEQYPHVGWLRADHANKTPENCTAPMFVLGSGDPSAIWGVKYVKVNVRADRLEGANA